MYSPKFDYLELPSASINGKRYYTTPDSKFPSITTVLGQTESAEKKQIIENWRKSLGAQKADAYTKKAADHGTNVHLLCERFFKGEDLFAPDENGQPIPQTDRGAFNALKSHLRHMDEVWGIEVPLFSNMLRVAGRCDLIGKYKGTPSIVDFKTSTRLKSKEEIGNYALQLTFYATAHNEQFDTNIDQGIILMTAAGGFPMEFKFTLDDHLDELVERIEKFYETNKPLTC